MTASLADISTGRFARTVCPYRDAKKEMRNVKILLALRRPSVRLELPVPSARTMLRLFSKPYRMNPTVADVGTGGIAPYRPPVPSVRPREEAGGWFGRPQTSHLLLPPLFSLSLSKLQTLIHWKL